MKNGGARFETEAFGSTVTVLTDAILVCKSLAFKASPAYTGTHQSGGFCDKFDKLQRNLDNYQCHALFPKHWFSALTERVCDNVSKYSV